MELAQQGSPTVSISFDCELDKSIPTITQLPESVSTEVQTNYLRPKNIGK